MFFVPEALGSIAVDAIMLTIPLPPPVSTVRRGRIDAKGTRRWCSVGMVKPNPGVCVGGSLLRIDERAILFGGFTGRDPPESESRCDVSSR